MHLPGWLEKPFRMSSEAQYRWHTTYRRAVMLLALLGAVLIALSFLADAGERGLLTMAGVAAWIGGLLVRLLVADGGFPRSFN